MGRQHEIQQHGQDSPYTRLRGDVLRGLRGACVPSSGPFFRPSIRLLPPRPRRRQPRGGRFGSSPRRGLTGPSRAGVPRQDDAERFVSRLRFLQDPIGPDVLRCGRSSRRIYTSVRTHCADVYSYHPPSFSAPSFAGAAGGFSNSHRMTPARAYRPEAEPATCRKPVPVDG